MYLIAVIAVMLDDRYLRRSHPVQQSLEERDFAGATYA